MRTPICHFFVVMSLLMSGKAVAAYEIEFNKDSWRTNSVSFGDYPSNIPQGWTYTSTASSFNISSDRSGIENTDALKFGFYSTSKGKTAELKMGADICIPRSEIVCDNVIASLMLYVQPIEGKTT